MRKSVIYPFLCMRKYLMGANTIRDIDSNQKSVRYSVDACVFFFLHPSYIFYYGSDGNGGFVVQHKEIKIDDDCNMMMVHCIKIQKFHGLQPQNGFFLFGLSFSLSKRIIEAHVCFTHTYT